jgi:hypothetical protein
VFRMHGCGEGIFPVQCASADERKPRINIAVCSVGVVTTGYKAFVVTD